MREGSRILVLFTVFALATIAMAAPPTAGEKAGAKLLFAKGHGKLTDAQQIEIFRTLGLAVSPDGKGLTACDEPAGAEITFPDLNGDGVEEVLAIYGNGCTSGMTGSSASLFVKDAKGVYQANLGFPAASADPMETKSQGYPDLLIGGPGFCFPVYRWNGKEYDLHRQEAQSPGGCDNR